MNRSDFLPILEDIPAARQEMARHYGVHPYFTRRPSNVVRAYIEHYSRPGDVVLDPFGGSGVTAIEAMLLGRRAIHNDLNPLANFITAAIGDLSLHSTTPLRAAYERVSDRCQREVLALEHADDESVSVVLKQVKLPENILLPRSSDAERFYDLFTPRQLAVLALIKKAIECEPELPIRRLLLLAWSAAAAKLNKTFLSARGRAESRGGSSIFSIYRYKVASDIIELPIWQTFEGRFLNVVAAEEEILRIRDYAKRSGGACSESLQVLANDAATLTDVLGEKSVDYIFTDPPYGGHISYLDLSVLWNHWLDLPVHDADAEAIVGGELRLSNDHYKTKLQESAQQCMRLLRDDRWLTVVFQHWDVSYFEVILDAVADLGGVLRAAITHDKDVIWSMHKKKNAETVLGGEMLLTFYKSSIGPRQGPADNERVSLDDLLDRFLPELPAAGFRTETLFNRLLIEAWKHRSLDHVAVSPGVMLSKLEQRGWHYVADRHVWTSQEEQVRSEFSLTH